MNENDVEDEDEDTTGEPPEEEEEALTDAAALPSMISSKLWILYAIVLAIMTYKPF